MDSFPSSGPGGEALEGAGRVGQVAEETLNVVALLKQQLTELRAGRFEYFDGSQSPRIMLVMA